LEQRRQALAGVVVTVEVKRELILVMGLKMTVLRESQKNRKSKKDHQLVYRQNQKLLRVERRKKSLIWQIHLSNKLQLVILTSQVKVSRNSLFLI